MFACRILVCIVAGYSHCSCSYSFWCSINWRRDRRLIPPVCIQWNVSLLEGQQTVSLNFLPTSSIPTKVSHLFTGKSSCRRRLQIVQPYELAKVGSGVLQALKRAYINDIVDSVSSKLNYLRMTQRFTESFATLASMNNTFKLI